MESTEIALLPCMLPSVASTPSGSCDTIKSGISPMLEKMSPWGKTLVPESVVSFNDVMSEQLACQLQHAEEVTPAPESLIVDTETLNFGDVDVCDDFLLAQMLQREFDKEHDHILRNEEKKLNGDSKVSVSYGKYRRLTYTSSDEEDEDDDVLERNSRRHWDTYDQAKKVLQAVGKSGVSRQNNTTTTKHDLALCGRRNAGRLMEFPPGIETGDGSGFDMKISNNVYNTLKAHSMAEDRRSHKINDKKEKATAEKALDAKTRLILYKLVNSEILEGVNGCFSTGKEACVYHATSKTGNDEADSTEFALKIFKTTLNEFQNRDQYIKDDHRFRDRFKKQNPRKVIHMWAEKEMRNLMRMGKANIPCPAVIALKKHVLVMSFIGNCTRPAPKLKEIKLPFTDITLAYEQTVDIMKTLYRQCQLVHADLSEYNLLWHEEKVWVIDVSQAVEITHPRALEFLARDCRNVCDFFNRQGVKNVMTPEVLFTEVCGHLPRQ